MKIVTAKQMAALETASERAGVSTDQLMENAGQAIADQATDMLDGSGDASVLVLVGPGNNGGDGLVAARLLHCAGVKVLTYVCAKRRQPDYKLTLAREAGVSVAFLEEDPDLALLQRYLEQADLAIDAVLGTGRARPVEGRLRDVLFRLSEARRDYRTPILAVDLPSGLDADSGGVDPACPGADVTLALSNPKTGHVIFPGASVTGKLLTADIGVPKGLDGDVRLEIITPELVGALLPDRPRDGHKGTFGRTLVIGGSSSYVGAPVLACSGAYRAGAGLVTLATGNSVYPIAAARLTEATFLPLAETANGGISRKALGKVRAALPGYTSLVVGCGLGQSQSTFAFLNELLLGDNALGTPAVIDADALNGLATFNDWPDRMKLRAVLTPHPGEMSRLCGLPISEIEERRLSIAKAHAAAWRQVVLLKGAFSVVASPDGYTRVSPFANPVLASAGTGDVLAGVVGGLLSQGLSPFDAATCGVYLHAAAAERISHDIGDSGLMASDLLPEIPKQMRALKETRGTS